jgi:elongation factor Ts
MITTEHIKELRDLTGVSVMQCKKALEEAGGDMEKAKVVLMEASAAQAAKKQDRVLGAGAAAAYVHNSGSVVGAVVLGSETDFVSKNEEFVKLAYDIAMHVAAMSPKYLTAEEAPEDEKELALLTQPFVKNPEVTVGELIMQASQKFGEKIAVSDFKRLAV